MPTLKLPLDMSDACCLVAYKDHTKSWSHYFSRKCNSRVTQEINRLLQNQEMYGFAYTRQPIIFILSQINPIQTLKTQFI